MSGLSSGAGPVVEVLARDFDLVDVVVCPFADGRDALGKTATEQRQRVLHLRRDARVDRACDQAVSYKGADEILDGFLADVVATLDPHAPVSQDLHRIIADGEYAVAEWTSHARARNGAAYDNDYAVVFRVVAGKIAAVTEYCDTSYMKRVLIEQ